MSSKALIFEVIDADADMLGLTGPEMSVLVALVARYNSKRNGAEVWPSIAFVAKKTGFNDKTVRRAKQRLHELELIKIYSDYGKSDVCSINVEIILSLIHPYQNREGSGADPSQNREGYPSQNREGTPPKIGRGITKGITKLNKQIRTFGCSSASKVVDDPKQRQLAVLGIVAGAAEGMRVDCPEQPKIEKTEDSVLPKTAKDADP